MGKVTLVIDAARLPAGVSVSPGRILSLGGLEGNDRCFVGAIVTNRVSRRVSSKKTFPIAVGLCDLCGKRSEGPRVVKITSAYEIAEAIVVQHLRRVHDIASPLWAYEDDLTTQPIP